VENPLTPSKYMNNVITVNIKQIYIASMNNERERESEREIQKMK
jgi:hypothetical protein